MCGLWDCAGSRRLNVADPWIGDEKLMPTVRSWLLLLIAAGMVAGFGGCGGGSAPVASPAPVVTPTTTPSGAPGSVSANIGSAVPLGISPSQLERRFGAPAVALRHYRGGFDCSLYRIAEQPPFVKLRYCFRHRRLKFFSTYAIENSS
jgi:hypothetical protein